MLWSREKRNEWAQGSSRGGRVNMLTDRWEMGREGKGGAKGVSEAWSAHLWCHLWKRAKRCGGKG